MVYWTDTLIECPSQCFADVVAKDGTPYVLYLRWRRWRDPWTANFIRNITVEQWKRGRRGSDIWSREVFATHHVQYGCDDNLEQIKAALLAYWNAANEADTLHTYFGEDGA